MAHSFIRTDYARLTKLREAVTRLGYRVSELNLREKEEFPRIFLELEQVNQPTET